MNRGFYHFSEKPATLTREQHIKAKRIAENNNTFWMVNFSEMQNPVVKKAVYLLQNKNIESIEVFRENKAGILKLVDPISRLGIQGGDVLDKMYHELFVFAFLKAAGKQIDFKLQHVCNKCLTLDEINADNTGGTILADKIDGTNILDAVTQTTAIFDNNDVEVRLHSSWSGLSKRCRKILDEYEPKLDQPISTSGLKQGEDFHFYDEEARFFIVKGEKKLLGDLFHNHLYDLDKNKRIDIPNPESDTLYRSIKRAVMRAAGIPVKQIVNVNNCECE
jgi:hypothetical protein